MHEHTASSEPAAAAAGIGDRLRGVAPEEARHRLLRDERGHRAGDEERRQQAQQHVRREVGGEVAEPGFEHGADRRGD